ALGLRLRVLHAARGGQAHAARPQRCGAVARDPALPAPSRQDGRGPRAVARGRRRAAAGREHRRRGRALAGPCQQPRAEPAPWRVRTRLLPAGRAGRQAPLRARDDRGVHGAVAADGRAAFPRRHPSRAGAWAAAARDEAPPSPWRGRPGNSPARGYTRRSPARGDGADAGRSPGWKGAAGGAPPPPAAAQGRSPGGRGDPASPAADGAARLTRPPTRLTSLRGWRLPAGSSRPIRSVFMRRTTLILAILAATAVSGCSLRASRSSPALRAQQAAGQAE